MGVYLGSNEISGSGGGGGGDGLWEKIGDLPNSSTCITFDRCKYQEFYVAYPNTTTNQNSITGTFITDSLPVGCGSYPYNGCTTICTSPTEVTVKTNANNSNASLWGKEKNTSGGKIGYVDVLVVGGGGCGSRNTTNYVYSYGGAGGGVVECFKFPLYGQYPIPVKVGIGGGVCNCSYDCGCLTSRFSTLYACGGKLTSGTGTQCYRNRGTSGYPQGNDAYPENSSWTIACTVCLNGCTASSIFSFGGNGAGGIAPQPTDTGYKIMCRGSCFPDGCYAKTFKGNGGAGYYSTMSGEGHYYGGGGGGGGGEGSYNVCYYSGNYRECYLFSNMPGCGCHGGGNGGYLTSSSIGYSNNFIGCCSTRGQDGQYYGAGAGGGGCSTMTPDGVSDGCCRVAWGCQGIVIVRYPTDGSYGISNNTMGGIITTKTIDGKEYRIHTFTDTREPEIFYPVFK